MLALNHVWANSSQFNHVWSRSYFWWFLISLEKAATIFGPVPWVPYVALDIQGKSVPGTAGWKRSHPSTNTSKKEKNVSKNVRKKRFALQKHRFGAVRISFLHFNLITFYHKKKPIWRPKTVKEMCRCKIRWVSGPFPWRSSPCQNRHAHTPARVKSKPPT